MVHDKATRVWLVSVNGVLWAENIFAFVMENYSNSCTDGYNADYKQNTLTYTLQTEKQQHYCSKKNNINYFVIRITI